MAAPKMYGQLIHSFYMIENILNILLGAMYKNILYILYYIYGDIWMGPKLFLNVYGYSSRERKLKNPPIVAFIGLHRPRPRTLRHFLKTSSPSLSSSSIFFSKN